VAGADAQPIAVSSIASIKQCRIGKRYAIVKKVRTQK
jgi:hypothetical protein